jgi:AraC-like DNA-binding protein
MELPNTQIMGLKELILTKFTFKQLARKLKVSDKQLYNLLQDVDGMSMRRYKEILKWLGYKYTITIDPIELI